MPGPALPRRDARQPTMDILMIIFGLVALLFFRAIVIILVNAIFMGIGMIFVGILNVIGSIFSGSSGSAQSRPSPTNASPFDHRSDAVPRRLPIPTPQSRTPRVEPESPIPIRPRTQRPTPVPARPRPKPKPKVAPKPRPTAPKPGLISISPARRRPAVTVSDLGVDSSWDKPRKRAHLLREFARANSRMQVLRDADERSECQARLDRITRAIMELDNS